MLLRLWVFCVGLAALAEQCAPARADEAPNPEHSNRISFVNDVLPVLSKVGCNQGKCHGAAAGKGEFRLSLRGFAPELDYESLCRGALGRRIDLLHPEQSLILRKPSGNVPHQGGRVLPPESTEYAILLAWLRQGAPGPDPHEPRLVGLDVVPRRASLDRDEHAAARVVARFSDGSRREVTAWARYDTNDNAVASVSDDGTTVAHGPGKTALNAAYQDRVATLEIVVPFPPSPDLGDYQSLPRSNYIDELVIAGWQELRLWPSPPADDATFLRRVSLDVTGTLPTHEAVREFLADTNPEKRDRLIDRLLESPRFVDMWTQKWGDVFRVSREWLGEKAMWNFHHYLRRRIAENAPWDQVVYDLVAGQGQSDREGPPNYYRLQKVFNEAELWPLTAAETTAQTFLGIRIQCARCHNHPSDRWTQADYYGMASFFAQVRSKQPPGGGVVIFDRGEGEINHPRMGRALPPKPLDGETMPGDTNMTRREYLAQWITSPENPMFARMTANRVWRHFMGRGLVEPVDDLRASNPPSNGPLLDRMAQDLVEHRFDVRHLMRTILRSRTYQLSSLPIEQNRADTQFYSHYLPRRMTAEAILDALVQVTGVPEKLAGVPAGYHAQQLPDTKFASTFLDTFGRPLRRSASCECERVQDPNLAQALALMHSPVLESRVTADDALVAQLLESGRGGADVLEEIYLRSLSRPPSPEELETLLAQSNQLSDGVPADELPGRRREFFEDLLWVVLNSKEFLFNH